MGVDVQDLKERRAAFEEYAHASREAGGTFKEEVKQCRSAYAGGQLSEKARKELQSTGRPDLVINRIRVMADAVSGSEVVNRFEPKFFARNASLESEDSEKADVSNEAYRFVRQEAEAEHEESNAFRDTVNVGVGVSESYMDYEEDPDGKLKIDRADVLECGWDTSAKKQNLIDREWDFRGRWISKQRFESEFPDGEWPVARGDEGAVAQGVHDNDNPYAVWKSGSFFDPRRDSILVMHHQWYESVRQTRVFSPLREPFWVDKGADAGEAISAERQMVAAQGGDPMLVDFLEAPRRVYKEAYVAGSEFLVEPTEAPISGFSRQFITGFPDESNDKAVYFFGLIRAALDPQDLVNKLASSLVHQVASNPKGAVFYESGAFVNKEDALRQWVMPNGMIEMAPGSLTSGKRVPYDVARGASLPAGFDMLISFMSSVIPQVTGVNEQFFAGQAGDLARTANTAIQSVQRANQTLLSVLFDSLRRYRKAHAINTMDFIRRYFPPERLMHIVGPDGMRHVQFLKSAISPTMDVVIDEAPTSVNERMEAFGLLMQHGIFDTMLQMGLVPPSLWKHMPLPTEVRNDIAQMFEQQQQMVQQQQAAPPSA